MKYLISLIVLFIFYNLSGQTNYSTNPEVVEFITSDVDRFWESFDDLDVNGKRTFEDYLNNGSDGLKDFIEYRIESPKKLYKTVIERKEDYLKNRNILDSLDLVREKVRKSYVKLDSLYPNVVFPPVYFVVGRFNSGGTSKESGLILGVEMMSDLSYLPSLISHELIHYQQNPVKKHTLLQQSIDEGMSDFIGELISGLPNNSDYMKYGNEHKEALCVEFVSIMNDKAYQGWLYGSGGKKEGRPNDLGYWMGYWITKSYYDKQPDKKQAIYDILHIEDYNDFLKKSGFLDAYLNN